MHFNSPLQTLSLRSLKERIPTLPEKTVRPLAIGTDASQDTAEPFDYDTLTESNVS